MDVGHLEVELTARRNFSVIAHIGRPQSLLSMKTRSLMYFRSWQVNLVGQVCSCSRNACVHAFLTMCLGYLRSIVINVRLERSVDIEAVDRYHYEARERRERGGAG